jgi:P4 family phage/plasmid primase-like protien
MKRKNDNRKKVAFKLKVVSSEHKNNKTRFLEIRVFHLFFTLLSKSPFSSSEMLTSEEKSTKSGSGGGATSSQTTPPVIMVPARANFARFLQKHRIDKSGNVVTHTMMPLGPDGLFPGSFNIPDSSKEEFFSHYKREVLAGRSVAVVERHLSFGPVLCDIDLRYEQALPKGKRIYNLTFVTEVIASFWASIEQFICIDSTPRANECYVTEKPEPVFDEKKQVWKDGLHIVFPHLITYPNIQYVIRQEVISRMEVSVATMGLSNDIQDVFDEQVIYKNGWMMYGSHKEGKKPYMLYGEEIDDYNVSGVFIANKHVRNVTPTTDETFVKPVGSNISVPVLINLLSIRRANISDVADLTDLGKHEITVYEENEKRQIESTLSKPIAYSHSEDDVNYALQLSQLLNSSRAESYGSWFEVGCCLYNIDTKRLLEAFIEFSKRSSKHSEQDAIESSIRLWGTLERRSMTLGSLIRWAQQDNPIVFKELQKSSLDFKIKSCCDAFCKLEIEVDPKTNEKKTKSSRQNAEKCIFYISDILSHCFGEEFVCSNFQTKEWYEFVHHRWGRTDKGVTLRIKMNEDLYAIFVEWAARFETRLKSICPVQDPIRYEKHKRYRDCCREFKDILRQNKYKDLLMSQVAEKLYWKFHHSANVQKLVDLQVLPRIPSHFEEILDSNIFLIGMNNGVYDLEKHEFRSGRPEDYISMSTCNTYVDLSMDDSLVVEVKDFLRQIVPNEKIRVYLLLTMSSFLDGHPGTEKFYIWSGCGGNGKSKLVELIRQAIGDYFISVPVTLLVGKRAASNAATPELANLKGKRVNVMNEPEEGDKLSTGMMKEITGGDTIMARKLYGEPLYFRNGAKTVLLTNHDPKVSANDEGTWRRIEKVEFCSRFVDNPDTTKKTEKGYQLEYKKDINLDKKLVLWKEAFFWLLTYYYRIWKMGDAHYRWEQPEEDGTFRVGIEKGITIPDDVKEHTNRYRSNNDPIAKFLQKAVVVDPKGTVYLSDLFSLFTHVKTKQRLQYQGSKTEFQEYMLQSKYGKITTTEGHEGWVGYRLNKLKNIPDCSDYREEDSLLAFSESA